MSHLTQKTVNAADFTHENPKAMLILWDDEPKGLGLRLYPTGTKVWVYRYMWYGRKILMRLGRHPEMDLAEARSAALLAAGQVVQGKDPRADTGAKRTVSELADAYLSGHAYVHKKKSSAREDDRIISRYVLPVMGWFDVTEVSRDDAQRLHTRLRDTPYMANRVRSLLSTMFRLAEEWEWRAPHTNPVDYVKPYKEKVRRRSLTGEEVGRLASVLNEWPHQQAANIVRLLILTGARVGEILNMRWADVDFSQQQVLLRDSKTGEKILHLNAQANRVLQDLEQLSVEEGKEEANGYDLRIVQPGLVFPRRGNQWKPYTGLKHQWKLMLAEAGLEDVRLHDLRHYFGATAMSAGISLPVLASLLGHSTTRHTERYAEVQVDPQQHAVEAVGRELERVI